VRLVLLPGMEGTGRLFGPLLRILPQELRADVVAYPVDRFIDYAGLTDHVRALLPRESPFVLVAESFSGPIALRLASAPPHGLKGIVLVCTFAASPDPWAHRWLRWLAGAWIFRMPPPVCLVRAFLLGREAPDDLVRETVAVLRSVRPEVLASRLRMVLEIGPADRSGPGTVPVLYLQGRGDRLLGRRGLRTVLALKPDTAVVEIDGPHLLLQTRPEEALRRIGPFLKQIGRPDGPGRP